MKKKIVLACIVVAISIVFFLSTNPESIPVGALMVPILLAFAMTSISLAVVFHLLGVFGDNERKQRSVAVLCGVIAASCLVFQSTGGIVTSDVIVLVLIFVIGVLYIVKY